MKFVFKGLLGVVLLFTTGTSFAADTKKVSIQKFVDQFYQNKEAQKKSPRLFSHPRACPPSACPPPRRACTDVVCEKLGHFGCDEVYEVTAVGRMCRGNYDGSCVAAACDMLGPFACDELQEIGIVARACVGNFDMGCFYSVCNRLGHFGCDSIDEVEEVLNSCAGN